MAAQGCFPYIRLNVNAFPAGDYGIWSPDAERV